MNPLTSCRTCLVSIEHDQVEITDNMFEILENILQINKLPRHHASVNLPQNLCYNCFNQLMQIKRFQAQCKFSEEYLEARLKKALKYNENISTEIVKTNTVPSSPKNSKSQERTEIECINGEELYVDNYNDNHIEYEMDELGSTEEDQDEGERLEIEERLEDEDSALIIEYHDDDNNDESDENAENEKLQDLVKLENIDEEFIDEIDSIEIILDDIDTEGSKESKERETTNTNTNNTSNTNETICKKYNCDICDKSFNSKSSLRSHEYIHSDARPYICEVCGKAFRQSNILVTHMALHTGKKIECHLCGKKFARKSQLILHDRMHNDEKPFVCDFPNCNAAFRQNQYLNAHKETHTGIRRYQCTVCPRTFFNRPSLLGHLHRVHGNVFYQCDMCDRHCKKPQQIRNHMKSAHQIELTDVTHLKQRKSKNLDNCENSIDL